MRLRRFASGALIIVLSSAPVSAQGTRVIPWVSGGGGWALDIAQDKSYTSSTAHAEHVAFGWRVGKTRFMTEAVFAQSTYGDADTCTLPTRPCPQIYGVIGAAILLSAEAAASNGIPPRIAYSGGAGIYSVRPPKTSHRVAPGLQGDLDLAIIRNDHVDVLVGLKAIVFPRVRDDFLVATPITLGLRLW